MYMHVHADSPYVHVRTHALYMYMCVCTCMLPTCTTYSTGHIGAPPPMLIPIILFFPFVRVTDLDIMARPRSTECAA